MKRNQFISETRNPFFLLKQNTCSDDQHFFKIYWGADGKLAPTFPRSHWPWPQPKKINWFEEYEFPLRNTSSRLHSDGLSLWCKNTQSFTIFSGLLYRLNVRIRGRYLYICSHDPPSLMATTAANFHSRSSNPQLSHAVSEKAVAISSPRVWKPMEFCHPALLIGFFTSGTLEVCLPVVVIWWASDSPAAVQSLPVSPKPSRMRSWGIS